MSSADLILTGGRIFRGLAVGFTEALAISGGKVLAAGSAAEIATLAGPGTRTIDLAGRLAVPGLNDAHMHLVPLGLGMLEVGLRADTGANSIAVILERIATAARQVPPGSWIVASGYDHNELAEKRHPTVRELDAVAPDHPVYVKRTCSHIAITNSRALQAAGIDLETPVPEGGLIERRDGALTGLLAEGAMRLVSRVMPEPGREQLVAAIERAGTSMLAQGITSTMEAAAGMNGGMEEIAAFEEAAGTGRLPLRTWTCLYGNPDGIAEEAHAAGYRFGREVGLLRYGAIKVFADGSAGGLTAAMSQPYLVGEAGNHGVLCLPEREMHQYLAHYHAMGYQLAIHAIGDAAIEQVLSGIERAGTAEQPVLGRRHRIEHCGFLNDSQLRRMVAAGIDPVPQPVFLYDFGDLYLRNLGADRTDASHPMRRWLEAGLHPAASTDAPVCATDPFKNLYAMTTRRSRAGTLLGPEQRLSMAEALHTYTACGAYTQFAEDRMGRLVPGHFADIAVMSHDLFTIDPEQLRSEAHCDITIRGGEVVFDRLGQC
ncbi:amidohydrolase [Pseudoroseomonas wenyumeiae]|uniref:Amidohydrolase n=1 Tax=Teichococcus wenyumeiae TaxID=2478470 RepID=A0A3A9JGR6_9PROT|nr:amidohydrolase [Pseudoroseomonas wenyumeiae]RKK05550.1 amidohydrolase [Pseudoroseomonas wenyumeiae]RMI20720.1 amidohydrolase [Pseudoroseomonas wenyumeiae]